MKLITRELLKQNNACAHQLRLFNETFPNGAPLTLVAAHKAWDAGLSVAWLTRLLPLKAQRQALRERDRLWRKEERLCAAAMKKWSKAIKKAGQLLGLECERACARANKQMDREIYRIVREIVHQELKLMLRFLRQL